MTETDVRSTAGPARDLPRGRGIGVAVLFACTAFLGAALLFMIQPLAARLILPSFGGSATVWSTSSLLFQGLLLLGYVYAHVATRRLGTRWQPRTHLLLLALPLLVLPLALPADPAPAEDANPVLWLLRTLLLMVGLPFAVLSTTGPLIQRWYAWSDGPRSDDPYFLFAGGNLGSFIGLLAYPFVIEPHLGLSQQRLWWSVAFGLFLVLMAACALTVRRAPRPEPRHDRDQVAPSAAPARRLVIVWCFWAFLASSMMLAVTAHLSTDIAAVPLLWVLPLAAYLASFVIAFARRSRVAPTRAVIMCVVFAVSVGVISSSGGSALAGHVGLVVTANVVAVLLVGFAAHSRLAATRPVPEHLTLFYLVVSVGGALGGVLNGVVAPLLFEGVWEYWLTLALLPLLAVGLPGHASASLGAVGRVLAACLGVGAVVGVASALGVVSSRTMLLAVAVFVVTAIVAWLTLRAPVHLAVTLVFATVVVAVVQERSSVLTDRTFYGSYRVKVADGQHRFLHGTTLHGTQFLDAARAGTPTTYYAEDGPVGDLMDVIEPASTAVVGLGAGAIAAYGSSGEAIRFFEIDPAVARTASDPRWFSYVADSEADVDIVVGDGRLMLEREPPASYDLVVLDAFSSDSIPVHVLTLEAMEDYVGRLRPGGSVAVHISNRVFDLRPVLAAHAEDLGLTAMVGLGGEGPGATPSEWVVLTRSTATASALGEKARWAALPRSPTVRWTDDYSSVLSVLR